MDVRSKVTQIIKQVVNRWIKTTQYDSTYAINSGPCWEFAEDVAAELESAGIGCEIIDSVDYLEAEGLEMPNYYHYAVKVGQYYYDASMPEGTTSFMALPFMRAHARLIRPLHHDPEDEP
jgi:hypothetical protein